VNANAEARLNLDPAMDLVKEDLPLLVAGTMGKLADKISRPVVAEHLISAPVPQGATRSGRKARILIAEDNATNRFVTLAQLRKRGYKAAAVVNGAEAVESVERGFYDVVLMDCEMPVLDGYEATRRIRQSSRPSIPIIALTAHAMSGQRQRYLDAGMDDFLSKPVDMEQLAAVLAKWCSGPDPLR
jgi:CheY-like chemotaxis protein